MESVEKLLLEKYRTEQEKGEYLLNRLAHGYARIYAFRRSFLGRLIGHLERAIRYLTFRPSAKSELTQMYEAALQFEEQHNISLRDLLAQKG